jgi:hypothetical protein
VMTGGRHGLSLRRRWSQPDMMDAVEDLPTATVYRGSLFNSCWATRMTSSFR